MSVKTWRLAPLLVLALLLGAPAAAEAVEPPLTGTMVRVDPGNPYFPGTLTTTEVSCNTLTGEGVVRWRAEGTSSGESGGPTAYPGTYVEAGEFHISSVATSPGHPYRTVSSWTSTFTITSGDKVVTGTRTLRAGGPVNSGHCGALSFFNGFRQITHGRYTYGSVTTNYTAEIRTAGGTLLRRDAGHDDYSAVIEVRNPDENFMHENRGLVSDDADGDGIVNSSDNCPAESNRGQENSDGDAQGDACDADDDNDNVNDGADAFPLDPTEQVDTDGDETGNNADTDDDGDAVADGDDAFPLDKDEWVDTDGDTVGNNADTDDDADGHADSDDRFPLDKDEWADNDDDEIGDNDDADDDNDSVADESDNCQTVANDDQGDIDSDDKGDACDDDRDGDAVENTVDNCADVANDQLDTDGDGRGDACDSNDDDDTFEDAQDNCPTVVSDSLRDSDGDGKGDACDVQFDSNDGVTSGGGWAVGAQGGKVHLSYSATSFQGVITGIGELREGTKRVRLLDADGYSQTDNRSVIVGDAIVDGSTVRFRLETVDNGEPGRNDTFELEAGAKRWAGTLAGGNLQVQR